MENRKIESWIKNFSTPSCSCGKNNSDIFKKDLTFKTVQYTFVASLKASGLFYGLGDSNGIVQDVKDITVLDPVSGGPELRSYLQHKYLLVRSFQYQLSGSLTTDAFQRQFSQNFFLAGATIFGDDAQLQFSPNKYRNTNQFITTELTIPEPFMLTANTLLYFFIAFTAIDITINIVLDIADTGCYCQLNKTKYSIDEFPNPAKRINIIK